MRLSGRRTLVTLALAASALAGCASEPHVTPLAGVAAARPRVVGADGALTHAQVAAALSKLAPAPDDEALLRRHLAIEQAVAETPLVEGEATRVLPDGATTFRAMFAAIAGAKHEIDLEYYTFDDIHSDGQSLGDLLVARRAQGVTINVIYDAYGSGPTPPAFLDRLRKAGVNLVEYNPINPFKAKAGWAPNKRDHRKILVADGSLAIVGGVNMDHVYETSADRADTGTGGPRWRDTDLEIRGPAAQQLVALFQAHWRQQRGPALTGDPPPAAAAGKAVVRIIGSSPRHATPRYYVTLISAIRSAERSVTLSAAYFVPTREEMDALAEAARRGVNVRLMLPDHSDSALSLAVGRSHYGDLLEAGVKIYEIHGLTLHTKTVVVDGVWSVIGSSNFDHRSVIFNDEVDAVVLGDETAGELEALFDLDCTRARAIDLATWRKRPLGERLLEAYGRAWQALL
jgi:cardiolipin synthase